MAYKTGSTDSVESAEMPGNRVVTACYRTPPDILESLGKKYFSKLLKPLLVFGVKFSRKTSHIKGDLFLTASRFVQINLSAPKLAQLGGSHFFRLP